MSGCLVMIVVVVVMQSGRQGGGGGGRCHGRTTTHQQYGIHHGSRTSTIIIIMMDFGPITSSVGRHRPAPPFAFGTHGMKLLLLLFSIPKQIEPLLVLLLNPGGKRDIWCRAFETTG